MSAHVRSAIVFWAIVLAALAATPAAEETKPVAHAFPRERFTVDDRPAFVIRPAKKAPGPTPWILYAPTLGRNLPGEAEAWMFRQFLDAGIAIAGVDVGESFGSPQGRATYNALHRRLTSDEGFAERACLLARSRGGLMLYCWAMENPEKVRAIAGIYPVSNLVSYPGLSRACGAFGMTEPELAAKLSEHNPVDRLEPLAKAGIPIFHIHGDEDKVVPLEDNSALLARRYRAAGGPIELKTVEGQGHNMWRGFFECQELVDFVIRHATGEETTPVPTADDGNPDKYTVACYYFPNYHPNDPRNEERLGKGWSEWELVKNAKPRFPGHRQPRVPLWGHTDESDPKVMAHKIAAAADHGIDAFIFDWYYYEGGLFLERGLEEGFLKAANNRRLKFALMWANHDWIDIFPATLDHKPERIWPGTVTPREFDKITDYVIEKYFKHPSYWTINGRPYFSFYDLGKLLESFGSVEATRAELEKFRVKTRAAGFPGLHLNAVAWGQPVLPTTGIRVDPVKLVARLGFDSATSYVWLHHVQLPDFPETPYSYAMEKYFDYCDRAEKQFTVPYYPNVSMGWDSSPRCDPAGPFLNRGYPYTPTISGNTPEAFRAALARMKDRLDRRPAEERIFNINSFNEWTEGSYVEPDTVYGMKYLEAVRAVFGDKGSRSRPRK